LREALRYEVLPYPKGDNSYYKLGDRMKVKIINTKSGEVFYE